MSAIRRRPFEMLMTPNSVSAAVRRWPICSRSLRDRVQASATRRAVSGTIGISQHPPGQAPELPVAPLAGDREHRLEDDDHGDDRGRLPA